MQLDDFPLKKGRLTELFCIWEYQSAVIGNSRLQLQLWAGFVVFATVFGHFHGLHGSVSLLLYHPTISYRNDIKKLLWINTNKTTYFESKALLWLQNNRFLTSILSLFSPYTTKTEFSDKKYLPTHRIPQTIYPWTSIRHKKPLEPLLSENIGTGATFCTFKAVFVSRSERFYYKNWVFRRQYTFQWFQFYNKHIQTLLWETRKVFGG